MDEPSAIHRLTGRPSGVWTGPHIHVRMCSPDTFGRWPSLMKVEIDDCIVYLPMDHGQYAGTFNINDAPTRFVAKPEGEDLVLEVWS